MAVMLGSARIDERGNATGGQAGDQTGREVSTQTWYLHQKGWNVFRCRDPVAALKVAEAMQRACDNGRIGYDQNQRLTLYEAASKVEFDPGRVTTPCETDCSALVRVCLAYAGIKVANFRTSTQKQILLSSGEIVQMEGAKYEKSSDYLKAGDILCTKTQGHTVVVLTDGRYASSEAALPKESTLGDRILRNGSCGTDVMEMQQHLIELGYSCGIWGADGEMGDATEMALMDFQEEHGCEADGEYGLISHAAMEKALQEKKEPDVPHYVRIRGGNCWVRMRPTKEAGELGVAYEGDKLPYTGKTEDGWHNVNYGGWAGWVSGKYAKLEE